MQSLPTALPSKCVSEDFLRQMQPSRSSAHARFGSGSVLIGNPSGGLPAIPARAAFRRHRCSSFSAVTFSDSRNRAFDRATAIRTLCDDHKCGPQSALNRVTGHAMNRKERARRQTFSRLHRRTDVGDSATRLHAVDIRRSAFVGRDRNAARFMSTAAIHVFARCLARGFPFVGRQRHFRKSCVRCRPDRRIRSGIKASIGAAPARRPKRARLSHQLFENAHKKTCLRIIYTLRFRTPEGIVFPAKKKASELCRGRHTRRA